MIKNIIERETTCCTFSASDGQRDGVHSLTQDFAITTTG